MKAYQFAFYTFYQFFEFKARDRFSAWKAGMVITVLEEALVVAALIEIQTWFHLAYEPSIPSFFIPSALLLAGLNTYAFDYRNRWKHYAEKFKKYSRRELLIGRSLVLAVVVLIVGVTVAAVSHGRRVRMQSAISAHS